MGRRNTLMLFSGHTHWHTRSIWAETSATWDETHPCWKAVGASPRRVSRAQVPAACVRASLPFESASVTFEYPEPPSVFHEAWSYPDDLYLRNYSPAGAECGACPTSFLARPSAAQKCAHSPSALHKLPAIDLHSESPAIDRPPETTPVCNTHAPLTPSKPAAPTNQKLFYRIRFSSGREGAASAYQPYRPGEHVILEADRGEDCACIEELLTTPPQTAQTILRHAQPKDLEVLEVRKWQETRALERCAALVREKGFQMEVLRCEFQWDMRKLTIYFRSGRRIDFRELVRELFKHFKIRIWMSMENRPSK